MREPVTRATIEKAARDLSNRRRWGADDQIGALNSLSAQDLIEADKAFSLGLSLKEPIPSGLFGGLWNPIPTKLATGADTAAFETCYSIREHDIAAVCSDTWGCEVRPNEAKEANQPWRWVAIPAIGVLKGEIFYLKELADDCVSEFFFTAPPSPPPGGAGSPINPQAIR